MKRKNICCVGDDDQSIYGWRGAEVGNILKFGHDFPGAHTVKLEQNYRSTAPILATASAIIANNEDRLGKTLWTDKQGGDPVRVSTYENNFEETRQISEEISSLQSIHGVALKDIAILVRAGFQTRGFESSLMTEGVPYRVIGGLRFYERKEIRDMIAYLRATVSQHDDLALERIINTPKRGIGPSTMQKIYKTAHDYNMSLMQAMRKMLDDGSFTPKIRKDLQALSDNFTHWSKMRETHHHADITEAIARDSGYIDMLENEQSEESKTRLENIRELIRALGDFENLTHFLEHVSLVSDADDGNNADMVNIMTLHAAKGLEFNAVFLPSWEEGVFPNQRAIDESGAKGLHEERRLAYVGVTRARERLYISHANMRRVFRDDSYNPPSRFLDELPDEHIERINHSSYQAERVAASYRAPTESYTAPPMRTKEKRDSKAKGNGFHTGDKIFHEKFGTGRILNVQGNNVQIVFEKAGIKKIVDKFIRKI